MSRITDAELLTVLAALNLLEEGGAFVRASLYTDSVQATRDFDDCESSSPIVGSIQQKCSTL